METKNIEDCISYRNHDSTILGGECSVSENARSELKALTDTIAEQEKRIPKWVSIKDRLPENNSLILVCHLLTEAGRYEKGLGWYDRHDNYLTGVTHWMPLLSPPNPDKSQEGGEKCPDCEGKGYCREYLCGGYNDHDCETCNGTGKRVPDKSNSKGKTNE